VGILKAGDLSKWIPDMNSVQRTNQIKKLVERRMLQPVKEGRRQ
jgi:hypothetical protein